MSRNHGIHAAAPPAAMAITTQSTTASAVADAQASRGTSGRHQRAIGKGFQTHPAGPEPPRRVGRIGGGQLIEVDRGQVGEQCVELTERPRVENLLDPALELLSPQPPHGVMLTQQLRGPLPVRVRGAQSRVTRHRARRRPRRYRNAAE